MPPQTALDEYPLIQAWALLAYHMENHPMCPMRLADDGYIAQERFKPRQKR